MSANSDILDADRLLAAAQAETGLTDWGDDTFPDRFRIAVSHLRDQNLDEGNQRKAAYTCNWLLVPRLQFFEDRKRYPIAEEKIVQPLFGTGEARAGTTLLHALLSVDPHGRALRFWELYYPSPPPGLMQPGDTRQARADDDWREIQARLPGWWKMHPYNDMLGDGIPEDERAWGFDFRAMTPTAWWRVHMGMNVGVLPVDLKQMYAIHKMMLQQLQYARPKKYWVLKGFHGARLDTLWATYPDAKIIWTHRDPVQCIASRIALTGNLTEMLTGGVDWKEFAKQTVAACRVSFKQTLEDPKVSDPRIRHIRYPDFVKDPVAQIRGFYEHYGVPFPPETDKAMRDYLANNRSDRYGKFTYSLDLIGEDIDKLNEEFAPYRERFGLEIEKRH